MFKNWDRKFNFNKKAVLKSSAVHFTQSQSTQAKNDEYQRQEEERKAAEEAERQAQLAAQRAASYNGGGSSYGSSDGGSSYGGGSSTWYMQEAYSDLGGSSADANGALTRWDDNHYIAHNWSEAGKMIASHPDTIVHNGQTYKYAGTINAEHSRDMTDDEYNWTHGDGVLATQTCTGSGNGVELNRYELVN